MDAAIAPPFEAAIELSEDRLRMRVHVADPVNGVIPVVQATWDYDTSKAAKGKPQPREDELAVIAGQFAQTCQAYSAGQA